MHGHRLHLRNDASDIDAAGSILVKVHEALCDGSVPLHLIDDVVSSAADGLAV
jgi:hypothetical protein